MASSAPPPDQQAIAIAEFQQYVDRCVVLSDLSPHITTSVLRAALEQWGSVLDVQILRDPLDSKHAPGSALVEMSSPSQASDAASEIAQKPFMVGGAPRPVTAKRAKAKMFPDRPRLPPPNGEQRPAMALRCLDKSNPDWERCCKLKRLAQQHAAEAQCLKEKLREQEEKLASKQDEKVRQHFAILEMLQKREAEDTVHRYRDLVSRYSNGSYHFDRDRGAQF